VAGDRIIEIVLLFHIYHTRVDLCSVRLRRRTSYVYMKFPNIPTLYFSPSVQIVTQSMQGCVYSSTGHM